MIAISIYVSNMSSDQERSGRYSLSAEFRFISPGADGGDIITQAWPTTARDFTPEQLERVLDDIRAALP